jgi:hypothetical protein
MFSAIGVCLLRIPLEVHRHTPIVTSRIT